MSPRGSKSTGGSVGTASGISQTDVDAAFPIKSENSRQGRTAACRLLEKTVVCLFSGLEGTHARRFHSYCSAATGQSRDSSVQQDSNRFHSLHAKLSPLKVFHQVGFVTKSITCSRLLLYFLIWFSRGKFLPRSLAKRKRCCFCQRKQTVATFSPSSKCPSDTDL